MWFLPPESAAALGTAALFAVHVFALGDCLIRPSGAFVASGKKTKQFWSIILGVAAGCTLLLSNVTYTLVLAATVAALVYILDVRPAVQAFRGPRGGGGRQPRTPRGGW
ncbi:MAG: DUF2516 family protein [Sporichthya sp.]|nr:DUF2516 family protein [Sporichthya sp.]